MQMLNCGVAAAPGVQLQQQPQRRRLPAAAASSTSGALPLTRQASASQEQPSTISALDRRSLLAGAAALVAATACQPALAVQGITAGRIPGVTGPDADGYYTYKRPEGKSGGHGVGWTEVDRYSFKVPQNWEETPVSIADLGGTEIDLRYSNPDQGNLFVVVAPVARFKDIPFNTSVSVSELGEPEVLIAGFAPELYGGPLSEGEILDMQVVNKDGMLYYVYELSRHRLVSATATGNRLYILAISAKSVQWRRHADTLLKIRDSFTVPERQVA